MYKQIRTIKPLTQKYLKEIIHYNSENGIFTWKLSKRGRKCGKTGYVNSCGYVRMTIDRKIYLAHRLAWLYVYGKFPENNIDHINQKRNDNRIKNLRDVNEVENGKNRRMNKNNTSGFIGVSWNVLQNKWQANIMDNKKAHHLGYFTDIKEASEARKEAEIRYGYHENHGK